MPIQRAPVPVPSTSEAMIAAKAIAAAQSASTSIAQAVVREVDMPPPVQDEHDPPLNKRHAGTGQRCGAARTAVLDQQCDQHPAGEVRQERGRRVGCDRPPRGGVVDRVPAETDRGQAAQQRRLPAGTPAGPAPPQPPDHREHQVEDDLDRQRPRRGVELQQCVGRVVLPEQEEERKLRRVDQPPARHVARGPQQRDGPEDRDVVGGNDPGGAAHEEAAHVDGLTLCSGPREQTRDTAGSPTARRTSRRRHGPRTAASSPRSRASGPTVFGSW